MRILRCDHPDVEEFVSAKIDGASFSNFNLSIAVTDKFMEAGELFDPIVRAAWKTGDPGLVFLNEMNRRNPTPLIGKLETTSPCGELPLLP